MTRSLLRLLPLLVLAACTAAGVTGGDPLSRTFQWSDIMAGNDIRRACAQGSAERWRFVYNGIYSEQVRSYDIAEGQVEIRVFDRLGIGFVTTSSLEQFWRGARSTTPIAPEEMRRLVQAWESDLPNAVKPVGHLRSDRFFWTTTGCRGGRFVVAAFAYPPDASQPFAFAEELWRLDRSGKPINPPRPYRDAGTLADYTPSRHNSDDAVRFLLRVTADGIQPGY